MGPELRLVSDKLCALKQPEKNSLARGGRSSSCLRYMPDLS